MKWIKKLIRQETGNRWEVRKTIWPFPEGYGTYNPYRKMILDTGLTKERAQKICDDMNARDA